LVIYCPAFDQNIVDTVGAGDTFFAICSLAIGSKVNSKISMMMGAISAGFTVDQIGNKSYYNFPTFKKHLTHILK
jgi:sugar/nucleoside kinase (ribokinase family)